MEETKRSISLREVRRYINDTNYSKAFEALCTLRLKWPEEAYTIYSFLLRTARIGKLDVSKDLLVEIINEYETLLRETPAYRKNSNQVYHEIGMLMLSSVFNNKDYAYYYFCKCVISTDPNERKLVGGGFHLTASIISDMTSTVKLVGDYEPIYNAMCILLNETNINTDIIAHYVPNFILYDCNNPFVVEFDSYFYGRECNFELASKSIPSLLLQMLCKTSIRRPVRLCLFIIEIRDHLLRTKSDVNDHRTFLRAVACQEYINGGLHPPTDDDRTLLLSAKDPDLYESYGLYDCLPKADLRTRNPELYRMMIVEPEVERSLSTMITIDIHSAITDETSLAVSKQYDEDPYPKWIGTNTFLHSNAHKFFNDNAITFAINDSYDPKILIAGCGTGRDPLSLLYAFGGKCSIDAIDISLRALSYAYRRTKEYALTERISYKLMDLLNLEDVDKYDIVRSCGVIHHTKDPELALRTLVRALKPNGLLNIGVYSSHSREHLKAIATRYNIDRTDRSRENILKTYKLLIDKANTIGDLDILVFNDIHNYSMFRDLMFHVQECGYSMRWFKRIEHEYGLRFLNLQNRKAVRKTLDEWIELEESKSETEWENTIGWGLYNCWFEKL